MINECSVLNTGYSVYGREVLSRLHQTGKYEIAELATYVDRFDPRLNSIPWRVYPNLPDHHKNPEHKSQEKDEYDRSMTNVFGEYRFHHPIREHNAFLDFKPHIVFAIRDYWMDEFLSRSPYRRLYNLALLAPVDSVPQNEQWIDLYGNADGVFTYTDWGVETLRAQTNNGLKLIDAAPAIAAPDFFPIPKEARLQLKKSLGLSNYNIVGTVMRNQKRKLFPELFKAFRDYLDATKTNNTLLYCHTSYPDVGWDIPKLLLEYGLSSKVLFTYICSKCGDTLPSFFSGPLKQCAKCKETCVVAGVERGITNESLNIIYNMMDLYVQLATNEGQGMGQVEAAACGVPVMATDYSGMADVVRKVFGFPIPVVHMSLSTEEETYKAVPDVKWLSEFFAYFFSQNEDWHNKARDVSRAGFEKNYDSWDRTAEKWMKYFDTVDVNKYEALWTAPKQTITPAQFSDETNRMSNGEFVEWAIRYVLCDPSKIGSYFHLRLLRDLSVGQTFMGINGMFYNDFAYDFVKPRTSVVFNRETIYNHFLQLVHIYNSLEQMR